MKRPSPTTAERAWLQAPAVIAIPHQSDKTAVKPSARYLLRQCDLAQSKLRPLPRLPPNLHQITLLMRERHLPFLVKADALAILPQPDTHTNVSPVVPDMRRDRPAGLLEPESCLDLLLIIYPRLHHDRPRPRIRQPTMMHQRAQPHPHPLRAAERILPNQTMDPAVIIAYSSA